MFIYTISDIVGIIVLVVILLIFGAAWATEKLGHMLCQHKERWLYHDHAICKNCRKRLPPTESVNHDDSI